MSAESIGLRLSQTEVPIYFEEEYPGSQPASTFPSEDMTSAASDYKKIHDAQERTTLDMLRQMSISGPAAVTEELAASSIDLNALFTLAKEKLELLHTENPNRKFSSRTPARIEYGSDMYRIYKNEEPGKEPVIVFQKAEDCRKMTQENKFSISATGTEISVRIGGVQYNDAESKKLAKWIPILESKLTHLATQPECK
ncbi:MAG: hypothetical protein ACOYK9_01195 [Chlamydiia bacterium]